MHELKKAIENLLDSEQTGRDYPEESLRVGRKEFEHLWSVYLAIRDKL